MTTVEVPRDRKLDPEIEKLFREHCQLIYRTAYGITRDYGDADDVLQSIFLKLLRSGLPTSYAVETSCDLLSKLRRVRGDENPSSRDESSRRWATNNVLPRR